MGDKRLVGFFVGEVHYALEIDHVREIVNPGVTSALPRMPEAVVGVADHRGDVVPVVDARRHFGLPPAAPTRATKWILLGEGDGLLGLVVDRVTEVFGSTAPPREPPAAMGTPITRGVSWVAARGDELVFVLDAVRLSRLVADVAARLGEAPSGGAPASSSPPRGGEP